MTGARPYFKYVITIALLLTLLVIKYIALDVDSLQPSADSNVSLSLDGYYLYADRGVKLVSVKDIFAGSTSKHHKTTRPQAFTIPTDTESSRTTSLMNSEQKVAVDSDREIEHIKLLGIVFHGNKKRAYMALGAQRVIADMGDLVYGRYLLQNIAINSAVLVDTKEDKQKTIMVSGK